MTDISRILIIFSILYSNFYKCLGERVWIPSNVSDVWGNQPQYTIDDNGIVSSSKHHMISPSDVILLQKGLRSYLYFRNIKGDSDNYITITNEPGGIVEINSSLFNPSYTGGAFRLIECQYIKVSGKNSPGIKYGIKIAYSFWDQPLKNGKIVTGGGSHGISLERTNGSIPTEDLTNHIEIEYCEITNVGASAIAAKIDDAGNGIEGPDNSFVMRDIIIHDNYIHDIGMEGIYIGQSSSSPVWHSTVNVKIYDNIFARTGFEPIQIKQAWDVEVHNNVCYQASLLDGAAFGSENNGFQISTGTRGEFYNNIIMDGKNEYIHAVNKDGNVPDSLNELPEGSLINRLGSGIDFFNNYLDGGAETFTWDDTNDVNDYRSPVAAIYCQSDYKGTENRETNFYGNYMRNIYSGTNDPGKSKANLEFFFIRQDNSATPEDEEDKITYKIFDNYFSGTNEIETHGTPVNMELGNNQFLDLPEIEFVNPTYGTDNFCIVPGSYYYEKGISSSQPEAKGLGYSKCIVPVLTLANNTIPEAGDTILNFNAEIFKSSSFHTQPAKGVLIYKACNNCNQIKIADEININWTSSPVNISGSSYPLSSSTLNYGTGKVLLLVYNQEGIYKSNEIGLTPEFSNSENLILTNDKIFYNSVTPGSLGPIVATLSSGSIQWQSSFDGTTWSNIPGAIFTNYVSDSDINMTTYYRRLVDSSPSNIFTLTISNGPITNSPISANQLFSNSGDPLPLTGSHDIVNGNPVTGNIYQWQYSLDNLTYYDIPNATSLSYNPGLTTTTTWFRRNLQGQESSPYSIKVTINHLLIDNDQLETMECMPDSFNIKFTTSGKFNSNNVFKVELSNPDGNFPSSPITIGSKAGMISGDIKCEIPSDLSNGNYKIRIISTSPSIIGQESLVEKNLCSHITSLVEAGENLPCTLYPNPFSNDIKIKVENSAGEKINVCIVNLNGQVVYQRAYSSTEMEIKPVIPPGIYFLSIESGIRINRFKIVKTD